MTQNPPDHAPRLSYSHSGLDRASERRHDDRWIAAQQARPDTLFLPLWRYRHAMGLGADGPQAIFLPGPEAQPIIDQSSEIVFLGLRRQQAIFAVDLTAEDASEAEALCGGEMLDLRRVGPSLEASEAAMLAHARGLMYWHRHHRFCSRCGSLAKARQGGHVRRCLAEQCGKEVFPRLDPAVIMLIEYQPENGPCLCLLGRGCRWPEGNFSTLAGFMEPGESLEETVAREVLEEVGVEVSDVTYRGSQPWPFPSSLMLGFRAQASSLELAIDPKEIADARWFTARELQQFGEWQDPSFSLRLPRQDSIARYLVDSWLQEQLASES